MTKRAAATAEATTTEKLAYVAEHGGLSASEIATLLGASLASVVRWQRGNVHPSPATELRLDRLVAQIAGGQVPDAKAAQTEHVFASRGAARRAAPLFDRAHPVGLSPTPRPLPLRPGPRGFWNGGLSLLGTLLSDHERPSETLITPCLGGMSAGKNTYTYDAHTYHTKVPPQGIVELMSRYLPSGGLVLDPFAGSGMTGVAARVLGYDAILNELSPAASFISERFTASVAPTLFDSALDAILADLRPLRAQLYSTECRECGRSTEVLYTVWSYRVVCYRCAHEFVLWDSCRHYGRTVKEHKILAQFPCPSCSAELKKSRLHRTSAIPVLVGYKCCSRMQREHPPAQRDLAILRELECAPPLAENFYPTTPIPEGVNLSQPRRHGLLTISDLYTRRNLAALSQLWRAIHRIENDAAAATLAFAFTSLYQRVTRLSEFRFWGGSGNTANYNVPYIFNEANVFVTFARKAQSIRDHLATTASQYRGRLLVRTGSATSLAFVPNDTIDFIFTDPPFGANINYSEMNLLWESWLGTYTETELEAIVSRVQGKGLQEYKDLMKSSLCECYRVLRPGHWMVLVFMNSSGAVWEALREAVLESGFTLEAAEVFDKQHATFKQLVSDNTAGSDLLLHCRKPAAGTEHPHGQSPADSAPAIPAFLDGRHGPVPRLPFIHVARPSEIDYRTLYSEWLTTVLLGAGAPIGFSEFRRLASNHLAERDKSK